MNRRSAALAAALLLWAGTARAEEWHEAYRVGMTALARGDHARAADALRRAIARRPEPGRNVVTYGTNLEPRYFPYLRLAEACLALGQLDAARASLATSATWDREPAEERQKLQARLEAAAELRRPPPATAPAAATPAPTPNTPPTTLPAALPVPPTAAPESSVPAPHPAVPSPPSPAARDAVPGAPLPARPSARPPERVPAGSPEATLPVRPAGQPATGTLEIVSQPGGAVAYIDDEPVGSTDPETGRLVKSGLAARAHRVRVALAGHQDAVREVVVTPGSSVVFYATLPLLQERMASRAGLVGFAAVAVALVAVLAWLALRGSASGPSPVSGQTPRSELTAGGGGSPPSGHANPGARRDASGREWFGDFQLLALLGRGGMASVYKVERRGETFALKRPLASFIDDPDFLARFRRESEIGRTLNHPNIVRILDRGDAEGVPYFTMELLAGQTLDSLVRTRGALEPRRAASIVAQVGEALDYAHVKGVIHRDLKPSNIMLTPAEVAKVMDFGIARAQRFDGLTATGAFLGTPDYLAPEMIDGQNTEPRSDLYALGVILYELLTGQRPFTGDSPFVVLKKHCAQEPVPPSALRPGVPSALEAVVLRLLQKQPEQRPANAEELVITLREWLNHAA